MTERVRVEQLPGERPHAVKAARPADRSRLEHERTVLEAARHPGVVEFVGWRDLDDGSAEMITDFVGSRTLATAVRLLPEQVAALGAAIATTLADLHALGVTHGGLDESHVLLDRHGHPVLCGFAAASLHGAGPPDGGAIAAPSDDVEALGAMLARLLSCETESDPIPERRWMLGRAPRRTTWKRRLLLSLADQATYPTAHRRPTAASLARSLSDAVPTGQGDCCAQLGQNDPPVPAGSDAEAESAAPPTARRHNAAGRWLPVSAAAGLLLIAGGVLTWLQPGSGSEPDVTEALAQAAESPSIQSRETAFEPTTAAGASPSTPVPSGSPPTVVAAGRRFEVGQAGDVAVVGDWDCDGTETVALVRPSTGEVFVFDGWATGDQLAVPPTTVVERGVSAEGRVGRSGCPTLVVTTDNGADHEIALAKEGEQ